MGITDVFLSYSFIDKNKGTTKDNNSSNKMQQKTQKDNPPKALSINKGKKVNQRSNINIKFEKDNTIKSMTMHSKNNLYIFSDEIKHNSVNKLIKIFFHN